MGEQLHFYNEGYGDEVFCAGRIKKACSKAGHNQKGYVMWG